jgi:hypothetical protein
MERRDFLRFSAVGGASVASVGTVGCATLGGGPAPPAVLLSNAEMASFLGRLDRSMAAISSGNVFARMFPEATAAAASDPNYEKHQAILRKTLRSLLLVGSFRDLPEEGRAHPGMQDRMWRSMAEMDEAMQGMAWAVDALTPTEQADIGAALREDPGLGMRIVEALDTEGAAQGVSLARRTHMRALAVHACSRLKQSTPMLIDEYVGKVQKVAARSGAFAEVERRVAAQMGETAFWEMRERNIAAVARWNVADSGSGVWTDPPPGQSAPQNPPVRGVEAITAGAILLGVGVIVVAAGGIVVGTGGGIGGAVAMTVGGILGLAGLITLIVGLALRYG